MKKCDCDKLKSEGLFEFYLDDALSNEEKKQVEDFLTLCADCRSYFERIKNMNAFLRDSLSDESIPDLEDRMVHNFRKHVTPVRRFQLNKYGKIAAGLCFALITGMVIEQSLNPHAKLSMVFNDVEYESGIDNSQLPGDKYQFGPPTTQPNININDGIEAPKNTRLHDATLTVTGGYNKDSLTVLDDIKSEYFLTHKTNFAAQLPVEPESPEEAVLEEVIVPDNSESANSYDFAEAKGNPDDSSNVNFTRSRYVSDSLVTGQEIDRRSRSYGKLGKRLKKIQQETQTYDQTKKDHFGNDWNGDKGFSNGKKTKNQEDALKEEEIVLKELKPMKKSLAPARKEMRDQMKRLEKVDEEDKKTIQHSESDVQDQSRPVTDSTLKLVRTGHASYEVENYNSTVKRLERLARENEGYLASESSNRKANGKMEGQLVFKIKAANFTSFMESLKGIGESKYHNVKVQDVTKHYFDMQNHLESLNARKASLMKALEERKGDLKAYVEFESKLAEVLADINKTQGSLKFMAHQITLSTLHLTLIEIGSQQAATLVKKEKSTMTESVPDVDAAYLEAKQMAAKLKVNILNSHVTKGKNRLHTKAHMTFQGTSSQFDELIQQLSDLGHVSQLTRQSEDSAPRGHTPSSNATLKEGQGTLKLTFQHLPDFVVDQNQLVMWVDDIATTYSEVNKMVDAGFRIIKKEIDSFTENAKNCRFRLVIDKDLYNKHIASLRSLGKVKVENGSPILPLTPEGEPLPEFQKRIVQLDVSFNTLNPILTQTLDAQLMTTDVANAFHTLKRKALSDNFKIISQELHDTTSNAAYANLIVEMPLEHYFDYEDSVLNSDNLSIFVKQKKTWDISETPGKGEDIPKFQKKIARVSLQFHKLNPVIVESRNIQVKVKKDQLSSSYSDMRRVAKKFETASLSESSYNPKQGNIRFTVTLSEEDLGPLVDQLTQKVVEGGRVFETSKWLRDENVDTPLKEYEKNLAVAKAHIVFVPFTPTVVKASDIELHSTEPEKILEEARKFCEAKGQLLTFSTRSNDDSERYGELKVQMEIDQYELFLSTFKSFEGVTVLKNKNGSENPNDPQFKDEWKVGLIDLKITNDRGGLLSAADSNNYFGQIWDTVTGGLKIVFKFIFIGLPFLLIGWGFYKLVNKLVIKSS